MVFTGSACFGQVEMIDGWFTLGGRSISNEICFIDIAKEVVGLFILLGL